MHLSTDRQPNRLPKKFPVGATYVVEGSGGEDGHLRVFSRYVVLPGGRRINIPADLGQSASPLAHVRRNRSERSWKPGKNRSEGGGKKYFAAGGTTRQHGR
jgi:hypothetical protein